MENASLKNRLAQKTVELNRTLSEVLDMLDAGGCFFFTFEMCACMCVF